MALLQLAIFTQFYSLRFIRQILNQNWLDFTAGGQCTYLITAKTFIKQSFINNT